MGEATLLRTLTLKSILRFGKHAESSVQQIIDIDEINYLRRVYYHCSNITFIEDILILIGIREDERILKPGKNPELYKEILENILKSRKINIIKENRSKGRRKARYVNFVKSTSCWTDRKVLAWKNQGHH